MRHRDFVKFGCIILLFVSFFAGCVLDPPINSGPECPNASMQLGFRCAPDEYCFKESQCKRAGEECREAQENTNGSGYCFSPDYQCLNDECVLIRECSNEDKEEKCGKNADCDTGFCMCGEESCSGTDNICCKTEQGEAVGCFDLRSDPNHCGECNVACDPYYACVDGKCVSPCPPDTTLCGKECVDLRYNSNHCGSCNTKCLDPYYCEEGFCFDHCPFGYTLCGDKCVDLQNDPQHCGECGVSCDIHEFEFATEVLCFNGKCGVSECKHGYGVENGNCVPKPFVFTVIVFEPDTTVRFNTTSDKLMMPLRNLNTATMPTGQTSTDNIVPFLDNYKNEDAIIDCGPLGQRLIDAPFSCRFSSGGIHEIRIYGSIDHMSLCAEWFTSNDRGKYSFKQVKQWGQGQWKSLVAMFFHCETLDIVASDVPNFSQVRDASFMFANTKEITLPPNMWDNTEKIDFSKMFMKSESIGNGLIYWNTRNVVNMNGMFYGAFNFNHSITHWDTSKVQDMGYMFYDAFAFNQDLSSWDVSNVKVSSHMFYAPNFKQSLRNWNLAKLHNSYHSMFMNNYPCYNLINFSLPSHVFLPDLGCSTEGW